MNFVEELKWRGMLHDVMPGTEEQLKKEMTRIRWRSQIKHLRTLDGNT